MNERVKELRTALGLSAEKFGERVGVTRSAISRIENGVVNITEQMQKSICREFNVNEEWLRNGAGEMFNILSQDEELAYIVGQVLPQANDFVKNAFISFGRLSQEFTPDDWVVVKKFIDALAGEGK
ncbi:MAG: helix-turn-helix transcriptional regulator [Lachnospiraceae bacterium]|nr:helix-turn-helix transcriptional regulator [Lachnospiraceae bacterium]